MCCMNASYLFHSARNKTCQGKPTFQFCSTSRDLCASVLVIHILYWEILVIHGFFPPGGWDLVGKSHSSVLALSHLGKQDMFFPSIFSCYRNQWKLALLEQETEAAGKHPIPALILPVQLWGRLEEGGLPLQELRQEARSFPVLEDVRSCCWTSCFKSCELHAFDFGVFVEAHSHFIFRDRDYHQHPYLLWAPWLIKIMMISLMVCHHSSLLSCFAISRAWFAKPQCGGTWKNCQTCYRSCAMLFSGPHDSWYH